MGVDAKLLELGGPKARGKTYDEADDREEEDEGHVRVDQEVDPDEAPLEGSVQQYRWYSDSYKCRYK